jgi:hypothetical protein
MVAQSRLRQKIREALADMVKREEQERSYRMRLWRRIRDLEQQLAEARGALEKISGAGAWDAAHTASEALATIVRAEGRRILP